MVSDSLDEIRHRINAGDREGARLTLVELLKIDADNVEAWALLAILLEDPAEQAQCYREIVRVDPENRQAAAWLEALTPQRPEPVGQEASPRVAGLTLLCSQCGGVTEVRFVGELRDKRAFCPHCGSQIDLPDTYQRVERRREKEQDPWGGSRTVESIRVETRSDHSPAGQVPSEMHEIDKLLQQLDLSDAGGEAPEQIGVRDAEAGVSQWSAASSTVRTEERSFLDRVLGRRRKGAAVSEAQSVHTDQEDALAQAGQLTPEAIIRLAGGPLPLEERRECHNCGAVVPRTEPKCSWCSAPLAALDEE
jgi:hypothetical protein